MRRRAIQLLTALACSALLPTAFSAEVTVVMADTSLRLNSTFTASSQLASWLSLHEDVLDPLGAGVVSSTVVQRPTVSGTLVDRLVPTLTTPVTRITFEDTTGEVRVIETSGGMRLDSGGAAAALGITGGQVNIEDMVIVFAADHSASVYGRLYGQSATGRVVDAQEMLFRVNSSDVSIQPFAQYGFQATTFSLSRLLLTPQAFESMTVALGLTADDLSYAALVTTANDFGSLQIGTAASVPEPATLGLMALGLIAVAVAAARQRAPLA